MDLPREGRQEPHGFGGAGAQLPAGYVAEYMNDTWPPDCDDADPNAWREASVYADSDGDPGVQSSGDEGALLLDGT